MAVDTLQRLKARREARFHVQIQVEEVGSAPPSAGLIAIKGQVIRVFRGQELLRCGDRLEFAVPVCQEGEDVPPGTGYLIYEGVVNATHMEAYLNGEPPLCTVPLDECMVIEGPSEREAMSIAELERLLESPPPKAGEQTSRKWWKFW